MVSSTGVSSTQVWTCHRSTWSTRSRLSDASSVLIRWPRDTLVSRTPRRREMPALVAITTSSRATTSPTRVAISSSDAPSPYPAAVSRRVPPASANAISWSRASCSSVSRPHISVPSPSRETWRPVFPTVRCSMGRTVAVGLRVVVDLLKAVFLGTLQGLTEFLPISSSAHLRIFPELLGWGDPGAAFTAVVQIGTEVAVLLFFRKDIWRIATAWSRSLLQPEFRGHLDARMGWFIIIGSVPIVVLGILLKDVIEQDFRNLWIIGTTLIVLGVILGIADRIGASDKRIKDMSLRDAVLMGLAQAAALVPGVSRSGATISMGRLLGYEREAATRYAFLLAIPAVVGAGLFQLREIPRGDNAYGWGPTIVATLVAFVVGYAAIAWLLRYVSTRSYLPFVLYRIGLGSLTLALLAAGVISA